MACDSGNTVTVTITGNPTNGYTANPSSITVPYHGCITMDVPSGGCVLCLNNDLDGNGKQISLSASRTFGPLRDASGTSWTYTIQAPSTSCPSQAAAVTGGSGGNTIQVGSTSGQ